MNLKPKTLQRLGRVFIVLFVAGFFYAPAQMAAGFDLPNRRYNQDSSLNSSNIGQMVTAYIIPTEDLVTHAPLVLGDWLYFADWGGNVYAADSGTGEMLWQTQVQENVNNEWPWYGFAGTGALATDEGLLIEASVEGFAYGIDLETGEVVWETEIAEQELGGNLSDLLYYDGLVYIGMSSPSEALDARVPNFEPSYQGNLVALEAATGEIVWRTYLVDAPQNGATVWSSFALDSELGLLYFTTSNNYTGEASDTSDAVIAVDAETGEIAWVSQVTENDVWTLAEPVGPDYAFGAGAQLFEAEVDGEMRNLVGAGQKSGYYWVFDRETGELVWSTFVGWPAVGGGIRGEAGIGDGRVLVWSNNNYVDGQPPEEFPITVKALDAATGETLWYVSEAQPAVGVAGGFLANDVFFVGSLDGTLNAYRASDGRVVWSDSVPGAVGGSLVVVNNALFVSVGVPSGFGADTTRNGVYVFSVPVEFMDEPDDSVPDQTDTTEGTATDTTEDTTEDTGDTGAEDAAPADEGAVIIELGDDSITRAEFDERFEVAARNLAAQQGIPYSEETRDIFNQLRPSFLDQLATEAVLLREAEARDIAPDTEAIDARIEEFRSGFQSEEAYRDFLREASFGDEADLRDFLSERETVQLILADLREDTEVSDEEVQAFYEENQAQFGPDFNAVAPQVREALVLERLDETLMGLREDYGLTIYPGNVSDDLAAELEEAGQDTDTETGDTEVDTEADTDTLSADTLSAVILDTPELSTFAQALEAANLVTYFDSTGPFTIFAPNNDAFAALPEAELEALLNDPVRLEALIFYHVTSGLILLADLEGDTLSMGDGNRIPVSMVDGTLTLFDDVSIETPDLEASNGVIHVIDTVLIPPTE